MTRGLSSVSRRDRNVLQGLRDSVGSFGSGSSGSLGTAGRLGFGMAGISGLGRDGSSGLGRVGSSGFGNEGSSGFGRVGIEGNSGFGNSGILGSSVSKSWRTAYTPFPLINATTMSRTGRRRNFGCEAMAKSRSRVSSCGATRGLGLWDLSVIRIGTYRGLLIGREIGAVRWRMWQCGSKRLLGRLCFVSSTVHPQNRRMSVALIWLKSSPRVNILSSAQSEILLKGHSRWNNR